MVRISAFSAVRPLPNLASRVASVPYDVVNTEEARALADGNDISFLHVTRPEIDCPPGTDAHSDEMYKRARENLDALRAREVLVQDDEPAIYLYRLVWKGRVQTGIVCCGHIDDYERGLIKKHEKTRPDKEDDRTTHLLTVGANPGPVFLAYRDDAAISALIIADINQRPECHFDAADGVTHTVWKTRDPAAYVRAFDALPATYVADGHHRAASAWRAGIQRRKEGAGPDARSNWFLTVVFPASELTILPYHRLIKDLRGQSAGEVLDRIRAIANVTKTDDPEAPARGSFCLYLADAWYRVSFDPATVDQSDPIGSLDASLVQTRILEPVFGIGDPRTDPRIDFVGGIRGPGELVKRVKAGEGEAAISMYATSIDELLSVADAGLMMPPKSTWFEPKLRSGLFVHLIE